VLDGGVRPDGEQHDAGDQCQMRVAVGIALMLPPRGVYCVLALGERILPSSRLAAKTSVGRAGLELATDGL